MPTLSRIVSGLQADLQANHIPYPPMALASGTNIHFYRAVLELLLEGKLVYNPQTEKICHVVNLEKN